MDQFSMCGMLINGTPLDVYCAAALLDYSIGDVDTESVTFQGVNRSTVKLLKTKYGTRQVTITIVFTGATRREASLNRSKLNSALFEQAEIFISDDGFFYTVVCESRGEEELVGISDDCAKIKSTYQLRGVRHDALVSETIAGGQSIFCRSSLALTDCRLSVTVGAASAAYTLGGAVFANVSKGDKLVFDGIGGIITKNGANAAASVTWVNFPQLTPGLNKITAADPVTVEYYPTFI